MNKSIEHYQERNENENESVNDSNLRQALTEDNSQTIIRSGSQLKGMK